MAGQDMRTPLSRVLHFGAAHEGTTHFWRQRVTGAANAVLSIAFILLMLMVVGKPYAEVVAILSSPLAALILDVRDDRIHNIYAIANPDKLHALALPA